MFGRLIFCSLPKMSLACLSGRANGARKIAALTPRGKCSRLKATSCSDRRRARRAESPPTVSAIADAVRWAEEIMRVIDERWPSCQA